jgi:outer membrane lipoprotein-sorting protein
MEVCMKNGKKLIMVFLVSLIVGLSVSCTSTGEYMPLKDGETVMGTVQAHFTYRSSLFSMKSVKDKVNTEAYIYLLEAAGKKYTGNIDIREIVWVTGRSVDPQNTEISATGKVIQIE